MTEELAQLSGKPALPKGQAKRKPLPPELPRTEVRHKPDSTTCACSCQLKRIGEDVAEKLDYNDASTLQLPSYTTLDLSADYKYSKTTDVGFRIRNATDELYAESAYGNTQVLIANPRTYELSLRMKF